MNVLEQMYSIKSVSLNSQLNIILVMFFYFTINLRR